MGDYGYALAVDSSGTAYVGGSTNSLNFPTTTGAFLTTDSLAFCGAGFVTKVNAGGSGLLYSTFVGPSGPGPCTTAVSGIALDSAANAYIVGSTRSTSFPVTPNAFQSTNQGDYDAFLTELSADGGTLIYSSYLGNAVAHFAAGGADLETSATGVAVDASSDVYVTGNTDSLDFPVTPFAFQPAYGGGAADAFVTKFPLGAPGGLSITGIIPNAGGNAGTVSPQIAGSGFHAGATAQLNCGSAIAGTNVNIGPGGRLLNTTFDLTAASPGTCSLVITNPDGTTATLSGAFTVQPGGAPNIQISLTGVVRVSPPQDQSHFPSSAAVFVTVSNAGNVDSAGLVLEPVLTPFSLTSVSPPGVADLATLMSDSEVTWSSPLTAGASQVFTSTATTFSSLSASSLPAAGASQVSTSIAAISSPMGSPTAGACVMQNFQRQNFDFCMAANVCGLCSPPNPLCTGLPATLEVTACNDCNNAGANCSDGTLSCPADTARCQAEISTLAALLKRGGNIINSCMQGNCTSSPVQEIAASDPNGLAGPSGVGGQGWVAGAQALTYGISFLNEPTATAPAQQVVVTQPLGPNVNLSALTLPGITIPNGASNVQVTVPPGSFSPAAGMNEFTTNADLRPTQSLLVGVDAKLNPATRTLTWTFTSIDPTTGLPTFNPLVGFLPPGAGASVSFSVKPAPGIVTGSQVADQATVVFDANPPMSTETWTNTIDNSPPTSQVASLPATESCPNFKVAWSGSDVGSGVQGISIFVSDTGSPFVPWLSNTTTTIGTFTGAVGHSYGFYGIAQDLTGNIQAGKTSADAATQVTSAGSCAPPV